jgi:hypothetical protein
VYHNNRRRMSICVYMVYNCVNCCDTCVIIEGEVKGLVVIRTSSTLEASCHRIR